MWYATFMVKIAFSSDNHIDVNKLDRWEVLERQAAYLVREKIDFYVMVGDFFNDFNLTLQFARDLQTRVQTTTTVRFLVGNHDMAGVSLAELEQPVDELYLHHKTLQVAPNIQLVGNNGWYNYDFVAQDYTLAEILAFKNLWYDRRLDRSVPDYARFELSLAQLRHDLTAVAGQQTLVATHFVPRIETIQRFEHSRLDRMNAFLGSRRYGELFDERGVQTVVSGHLHVGQKSLQSAATLYYNSAVGYSNPRHHEWSQPDFFTEWKKQLVVINL